MSQYRERADVEPLPTERATASRTVLASLLVETIRQLSATRAAYHAALSLLATRERELRETRERYHASLAEGRRLRASVMRKAVAA